MWMVAVKPESFCKDIWCSLSLQPKHPDSKIYFYFMYVFCLYVCMCTTCVLVIHRDQKREPRTSSGAENIEPTLPLFETGSYYYRPGCLGLLNVEQAGLQFRDHLLLCPGTKGVSHHTCPLFVSVLCFWDRSMCGLCRPGWLQNSQSHAVPMPGYFLSLPPSLLPLSPLPPFLSLPLPSLSGPPPHTDFSLCGPTGLGLIV